MLVIAAGSRRNPEVVEQFFLALPRVFAGDDIYFFQNPQCPQCNVFQITDWGAAEIQARCKGLSRSLPPVAMARV